MRRQLVPISIGLLGFLIATAIAGQMIFRGQGDTPAASFRYGLLYIVYAGIPSGARGSFRLLAFVAAVSGIWFTIALLQLAT